MWIAATPPHAKPLERAARWDGVYVNLPSDTLSPLRPVELQAYLGTFLDDPALDVVTGRHPEHPPDAYEAIGTSWLIETSFPGLDWLPTFRSTIGLP